MKQYIAIIRYGFSYMWMQLRESYYMQKLNKKKITEQIYFEKVGYPF